MLFEKTASVVTAKREEEILEFWNKERIFQQSIKNREGCKPFVFFEGPPTANGMPHPGHVLTKAMKDLVPRYKTMCGCHVGRKAGWDTHGLPVELEVEKQLGLTCKQDIERYGIEAFIKKCRESVFKYEGEWRRMVTRGGFWVDMEDPYITCTDGYIETVWWILSKFWEKGLLYEGHKVVPYCPRCGTALSSHEVAQGYDEVEDPSVYVRFKVKGQADTYFLVWTTTPWTLLSNVALAVGKDVEYVRVKHEGQTLIMAKARLEAVLKEGWEVVSTCTGAELAGIDYEPLYTFAKLEKKAHFVILGDFVSTEDGTGIVHIAPAFGEDDYRVGQANNLPVVQMVNLEGKFKPEVTPWAGRFVKEADGDIIRDLKASGKLFSAGRIKHTYPFCWRCDSPLLYYARHSWFIRTTAIKDEIIANNKKINWYPEHIRDGRFGNFLENMIDWAISRDRYWGTPLPIWKCRCGHQILIGSKEELKKRALKKFDEIELHKPYVDEVEVACDKCGELMKRVPEVIDCWFDSGAMHTAQWHYPFENVEKFKSQYPADFICEAVDQTRGWFYSLLVTSTFLHHVPAYKNVVVLGLICDKNGIKMSKSKGNVLDCMSLFDKYGADAVRWFLYSSTAPWNTRRFFEDGIAETQSRFLGTLQNVYSFFVMYANTESFDPKKHTMPLAQRTELDRWIVSRFNRVVGEVRAAMDQFEVTRATAAMETFVDELSNWYVRRSRRRFWGSIADAESLSAFVTLWEVLVGFSKLVAPFTPFISETIYQNLVRRIDPKAFASVHLCDYPVAEAAQMDEALERKMGFVMRVVQLGRAARNEDNLKVRQPLAEMKVVAPDATDRAALEAMKAIVMEELNVKAVTMLADGGALTNYLIKPNFRTIGKGPYKGFIPKIKAHLEAADGNAVHKAITAGGYAFEIEGNPVTLKAEDVEVCTLAAGELAVQTEGTLTVALDKKLTRPLILEGLARELVNKIQFMRKESGLEVQDRIRAAWHVADASKRADIEEMLKNHKEYICQETLAVALEPMADPSAGSEWNCNGILVRVQISKEQMQ